MLTGLDLLDNGSVREYSLGFSLRPMAPRPRFTSADRLHHWYGKLGAVDLRCKGLTDAARCPTLASESGITEGAAATDQDGRGPLLKSSGSGRPQAEAWSPGSGASGAVTWPAAAGSSAPGTPVDMGPHVGQQFQEHDGLVPGCLNRHHPACNGRPQARRRAGTYRTGERWTRSPSGNSTGHSGI
jgi:hypothetical protein